MSSDFIRSYTRGLRIPVFLGKFTDGARIPGGPYTLVQGGGFLATVASGIGLCNLLDLGWIAQLLVFPVAVGVLFALKKVPVTGRGPFQAAAALMRLYTAPATGRIDGTVPRFRRAHLTRAVTAPIIPTVHETAGTPAGERVLAAVPRQGVVSQEAPEPAALAEPVPVLTGVAGLLATHR